MPVSDQSPSAPPAYDIHTPPEDGPPLFADVHMSAQSLDDYREPKAVPELEPVNDFADQWGAQATGGTGWGANSPTSNAWLPFITTENYNDTDDVDDVDAYMPEIPKWWSKKYKELTPYRPGPGFLPSVLAMDIHIDALLLVKITEVPRPGQQTPADHVPPNLEDVHTAMPSKLFYDKDNHGWRYVDVLREPSLDLLRPLHNSEHPPLPEPRLRNRRMDCAHMGDTARKRTHHFHFYKTIVDSATLPEPLQHLAPRLPVLPIQFDERVDANYDDDDDNLLTYADTSDKGYLLDAYVCSLCNTYVIASPLIPGVIPSLVRDRLTARLQRNPPAGQTPNTSIALGWDLILRCVKARFLETVIKPVQ